MIQKKKKRKKKKKLSWQEVLVIIMVVILALLLVFSRGFRAARRVNVDHLQTFTGTLRQFTDESSVAGHNLDKNNGFDMAENRDAGSMNITRDMLLGRINPHSDPDFGIIDEQYASRAGMYLRRNALDAFLAMREKAEQEGIHLTVLSATRTFPHQKRIWEDKWNGVRILHGDILATDIDDPLERSKEILRFSAMPGTSRHHWGTDIDLNSLQNSYFLSGQGKKEYEWLRENAARFGFCQPYTAHGNRREGGYEEEKWHWSYRPLAKAFFNAFADKISYSDISGFDGAGTARELQVIRNYVLDVNSECY